MISLSFMLFSKIKRFLGEIETDNFTFSNNENDFLDVHCLGLLFPPLFYEFSAKSLANILVNYGDDINLPESNR